MRSRKIVGVSCCLLLWLFPPLVWGQSSPSCSSAGDVLLRVGGDVVRPLTLSTAEFNTLPRQVVRVTDHHGHAFVFERVALSAILRLAGVPLGKELRGTTLLTYVIVAAADGYRVVFALPELDPAFTDRVILLADRQDDQPLAAADGPLRLVVPGEKRPARWVRQVIELTIRRA
jgi:DMSO/TMAO reductase YedYZ molybdopterin-dependent catalytic subunit